MIRNSGVVTEAGWGGGVGGLVIHEESLRRSGQHVICRRGEEADETGRMQDVDAGMRGDAITGL